MTDLPPDREEIYWPELIVMGLIVGIPGTLVAFAAIADGLGWF